MCILPIMYDITCELEFDKKEKINIGPYLAIHNNLIIFPDQHIMKDCILKNIRYKNAKNKTIKLIKKNIAICNNDTLHVACELNNNDTR